MQVTEKFTFNQNCPARYVKVCHSTHEEGDFSVKTLRKSLLLCQNGWSGPPVLTFAKCSYCTQLVPYKRDCRESFVYNSVVYELGLQRGTQYVHEGLETTASLLLCTSF